MIKLVGADPTSDFDIIAVRSDATSTQTFTHAGKPYLLTYRADTGATRIAALSAVEQALTVGDQSYQGTWVKSLDHVDSYHIDQDTYLFKHSAKTGAVEVIRLVQDASTWGGALGSPLYTDAWGKKPVWDLLSIAHAGNW